jgi:hypothetical protein
VIRSPPVSISAAGNQVVKATADDGTTQISDSFNFYIGTASNIQPLPPGVTDGINYQAGDSSAILVLYAPFKTKVVVVGDFNNWTQSTAYQMYKTPDSNYYWLRIRGLKQGTEYAYQYIMDDTMLLRITTQKSAG